MANENKTEILEERLTKAAETFKEMKAQMEEKDKEIESLKNRITELEDELTFNGGATEEVQNLKGRLEKAKEIFAAQKAKITEMTEKAEEYEKIAEDVKVELDETRKQATELNERVTVLEEENANLYTKLSQIKEIVSE